MKKNILFVISAMVIFFSINSCSSHLNDVKKVPLATDQPISKPVSYTIQPGDQLEIKFFYNPELNETVRVRPDGNITLQLIDDVYVSGLRPAELDELLTKEFSRELRKPVVSVILKEMENRVIYVGGEVNRQGEIELSPYRSLTVAQAVFQAGGFMATAKPENTILIRKGDDNKPDPMRINLQNAMVGQGAEGDIILQPSDIIYIPKSFIAEANKWVNQYIEQLLLFRGFSAGFSYRVDDKGND